MGNKFTARIELTNRDSRDATATYWPGEIIAGRLFIKSRCSPEALKDLTLGIYGRAKVVITKQSTMYIQREELVKLLKPVTELATVPRSQSDPPHVQAFDFQFLLPAGSPPSLTINMDVGIKYTLQVHNTKKYFPRVYTLPLIVMPYRDVGAEPALQVPVGRKKDRVTSGKRDLDAKVTAWLDRGGCPRGGKIPLHVSIDNKSDVGVTYSELALYQTWCFWSHGHTETMRVRVQEYPGLSYGELAPHSVTFWDPEDGRLLLPATIPISGPLGCSIINFSYELEVKVVFEGHYHSSDGVLLTFPIVIGADLPSHVKEAVMCNADRINAGIAAMLLAGATRSEGSAQDDALKTAAALPT